jgi:hypothetical protein
MYKEVLRTITGIEIFPVLSLVIFLAVFLIMLAWVLGIDRDRLAAYARLPLDDEGIAPEPLSERAAVRGGQS